MKQITSNWISAVGVLCLFGALTLGGCLSPGEQTTEDAGGQEDGTSLQDTNQGDEDVAEGEDTSEGGQDAASDTNFDGDDDVGADTDGTGMDTSADGGSGDSGMMAGGCGEGTLNLNVNEQEPDADQAGSGRLGVIWFQLNDDPPRPDPQIAYDRAFDTSKSQFEIPMSEIEEPRDEVIFCERGCDDQTECDCKSDTKYKFGLAFVFVVEDANGNGQIDTSEALSGDGQRGIGQVMLAYSPNGKPKDQVLELFTSKLAEGCAPYGIVRMDGGFDKLSLEDLAKEFDLDVCAGPGNTCELNVPNIT